jgi:hypothetical protein
MAGSMEENFCGFETKSSAEKMSGSIIAGTPEKQAASMLARAVDFLPANESNDRE